MGAGRSVGMSSMGARVKVPDELAAREGLLPSATTYAREYLFTEAPMSVTVLPATHGMNHGLAMQVDESRLGEMLDQGVGRIGCPFLVRVNPTTGDMLVRLFPPRCPATGDDDSNSEGGSRASCREPASPTRSPSSPKSPTTNGRRRPPQSTNEPRSPLSPSRSPPVSPLTHALSNKSAALDSSSSSSSSDSNNNRGAPVRGGPITPQNVPVSRGGCRVIKAWAYRRAVSGTNELPLAPGAPTLVERTPHEVTITWLPPANDGGLVVKYEVEFRHSLEGKLPPLPPPPAPPPPPHPPLGNSKRGGGGAAARAAADEQKAREACMKRRETAESALVARNPLLYGWRKLSTLHWYEWTYATAAPPPGWTPRTVATAPPQVGPTGGEEEGGGVGEGGGGRRRSRRRRRMNSSHSNSSSDSSGCSSSSESSSSESDDDDEGGEEGEDNAGPHRRRGSGRPGGRRRGNKNKKNKNKKSTSNSLAEQGNRYRVELRRKKEVEGQWYGLSYGMKAKVEGLKPATALEFRVRCFNDYGWSAYSSAPPSGDGGGGGGGGGAVVISTSPTVPNSPSPPFAVHCAGDALWVAWQAPPANGSPLTAVELKWQRTALSAGDGGCGVEGHAASSSSPSSSSRDLGTLVLECPRGSNSSSSVSSGSSGGLGESSSMLSGGGGGSVPTSHFLRPLRPSSAYTLQVRARNAIGWGEWSSPASVQTTRLPMEVSSLEWDAPVLEQRVWWIELFDWRLGTNFLFHRLTGERRSLGSSSSSSTPSSPTQNSGDILGSGGGDGIFEDGDDEGGGGGAGRGGQGGGGGFGSVANNPSAVQVVAHYAEMRFRCKRFAFQRALRSELGLHSLSSSSSSSSSSSASSLWAVEPLSPPPQPFSPQPELHDTPSSAPASAASSSSSFPPTTTTTTTTAASSLAPSSTLLPPSSSYGQRHLWLRTSRADAAGAVLTRFASWNSDELRRKRLKVVFEGEDGIDSGGLGRDLFLIVSEAFAAPPPSPSSSSWSGEGGRAAPRYFRPVSGGGAVVEICPQGGGSASDWRAIGRFLGKALVDRQLVPGLPLSRPLRRQLLNRPVGLDDLRDVDSALHKSLSWALANPIQGVLFETFSVTTSTSSSSSSSAHAEGQTIENKGEEREESVVDLIADGRRVEVRDENKGEWVRLQAGWVLEHRVNAELTALKNGLGEVVEESLLAPFSEDELERLLVGECAVDVDEVRAFTEYQGVKGDDAAVLWLWEYWRGLRSSESSADVSGSSSSSSNNLNFSRGDLLRFVTGTSRTPLDGFDPPLCVVDGGVSSSGGLPRAHTCFNQLVLPRGLRTFEELARKFDDALAHTRAHNGEFLMT